MDHQAVPEWESLGNPNAPSELRALRSTPAGVRASSSPRGSWGVTGDMSHFTKAARKNIQTAQIGFVLVQWEDMKGTSAPSYDLRRDGILYRLRGFGPAWGTRKRGGQYWSCAVDSVIMVGLFLDGGSTFADRQYIRTRPSPLSPAQVCYLEALALDWNTATQAEMSTAKERLTMAFFRQEIHRLDRPGELEPNALFEAFGSCLGQLVTPVTKRLKCANKQCQHQISASDPRITSFVVTPLEASTVEEGLSAYFRQHDQADVPNQRCAICSSRVEDVHVYSYPPPRLAITLYPDLTLRPGLESDVESAEPLGARSYFHPAGFPISIQVANNPHDPGAGSRKARVFYRWLGGIYEDDNHFRVWWSDTDTPEDGQFLKIYDGLGPRTASLGLILGDVRPDNVDLPVPEPWVTHPSLVFLERVIRP